MRSGEPRGEFRGGSFLFRAAIALLVGAIFLGDDVADAQLFPWRTPRPTQTPAFTRTPGPTVTPGSDAATPTPTRQRFGGFRRTPTPKATPTPVAGPRPRVAGAISTSNTTVVVQFSKAMAESALNPGAYAIVQENVHPEVGALGVTGARFTDPTRLSVELTTRSQNEVTYRVTVTNVTDTFGQPLEDKQPFGVDPTTATFPGTPPPNGGIDSDDDGMTDDEEQFGYVVTIKLADGSTVQRQVTSNPDELDTDGDGLDDYTEGLLVTDPRDPDTDNDQLTDDVEFNEIFSDPTDQDTDGDSLLDGLEVDFFRTSAILPDTDGDQIPDDTEVSFANRNPRVADLPQPSLEIGEMRLELDVRFLEVTSTETKEIDSRTVGSTLTQSSRREFSRGESRTEEASIKVARSIGYEIEASKDPSVTLKQDFSTEESAGHSNTSQWSQTSSSDTSRAYEDSLTTGAEVTEGANVTREVRGARAQVAVMLRNVGDIAFTVKNLQVVALIQDPRNPSQFTPIATFLPDSEPEEGFNLGPLVPERGPFIFSNDEVFPQLVEDLMRQPRGLVFRFANYDMTDELGRNFAFSSQDVTDRTAVLAIDFGGEGTAAEILRAATGVGRKLDTNGNDEIDEDDRFVVYDGDGRQVGIAIRDALRALGLTEYDESVDPTDSLTDSEKDGSYSVERQVFGDEVIERIVRIRHRIARAGERKQWAIVTDTGIDDSKTLDEYILRTGDELSLAFLQDLDGDKLPAYVEAMNGCSDLEQDTDRDGLDDRFEVLIGWTVDLGLQGTRQVFSSCGIKDTDRDGLTDDVEAPAIIERENGLIRFDSGHEPRRDPGSYTSDLEIRLNDVISDPAKADSDGDGIDDGTEWLTGYDICLRGNTCPTPDDFAQFISSPELFDSDGDTASDGLEQRLGGNPTAADFDTFGDADGDGLVNAQETDGWDVLVRDLSDDGPGSTPAAGIGKICDSVCSDRLVDSPGHVYHVTSDPEDADSDDDGVSDFEEFLARPLHRPQGVPTVVGSDPRVADTDGDGLSDFEEITGFPLRDLGIIVTDPTDPDTDDDKLSDYEEADRGVRRIIRVPSKSPYQAFSNPVDPDADLDRLVDGDEKTAGSDPSKPNTDDDLRLDYDEVVLSARPFARLRPNVPDLLVRPVYNKLTVTGACDGGIAGQFRPDLNLRYPKRPTETDPSPVAEESVAVTATFQGSMLDCGGVVPDAGEPPCYVALGAGPADDFIVMPSQSALRIGLPTSAAFGMSTTPSLVEEFSFTGSIDERDGSAWSAHDPAMPFEFPDVSQIGTDDEGNPTNGSGLIRTPDLAPGINKLDIVYAPRSDCNLKLTVSYTAE